MADPVADGLQQGHALCTMASSRLPEASARSLNKPCTKALEGAWEAEMGRRLGKYDRGEVTAIDAEEVFAKARRLAQ